MDPNATLSLIGDLEADWRDRWEACADLLDWRRRGGFDPDWSAQPLAAYTFFSWDVATADGRTSLDPAKSDLGLRWIPLCAGS